jgi:hypothetical protein
VGTKAPPSEVPNVQQQQTAEEKKERHRRREQKEQKKTKSGRLLLLRSTQPGQPGCQARLPGCMNQTLAHSRQNEPFSLDES